VSAGTPTLEVEGYARIPIPAGCYGRSSERDHNVELAPELDRQLIALLVDPPTGVICWYERGDGNLLATIGSGCGPHREAEFQRLAANWTVKDQRNVIAECFIRCSEGDPKFCAL
jgi:hypothetical protein